MFLTGHIISLRGEVWANKTSLTPATFYQSACTKPGKWAVMYTHVRGSILPMFLTIFYYILELFLICGIFGFSFHFNASKYSKYLFLFFSQIWYSVIKNRFGFRLLFLIQINLILKKIHAATDTYRNIE